jgi:GTPase
VFVDEVEIHVAAGHGGAGALSFRREKFVPRGGPDGGNGGKGGSVYLVADPHRNTLVHFRFTPEFAARRGGQGEGSLRTGRDGDDLLIPVPVGTTVYRHDPVLGEADQVVADLTVAGERVLVAKGGRGGLGNAHFATSTNRAPRKHQPGEPGEAFHLRLTLKLLADVGLVGFPNAGKSTLIARVSAAKPKIADYPFTTLTPNLGVVTMSDQRSFVVADVPGLIAGAHEGHGLGYQFLRHIERTKVLIHLVDVSGASGRDPVEDFDTIRRELELYNRELLAKPHLVAANKIDALDEPDRVTRLADRARALDLPFFRVSAVTGEGVPQLLEAAWPHIAEARDADAAAAKLHQDVMEPARLKPEVAATGSEHDVRAGDLAGGEGTRGRAPEDLPPDYNPALVPPVKGGSRGKGSRKR